MAWTLGDTPDSKLGTDILTGSISVASGYDLGAFAEADLCMRLGLLPERLCESEAIGVLEWTPAPIQKLLKV